MKKYIISILVFLLTLIPVIAQEQTIEQEVAQTEEVVVQEVKEEKVDALVEYRKGRNLKNAGKIAESKVAFKRSTDACYKELQDKPNNIESYVVLTWALLGDENYKDCITESKKALRIYSKENRIIETIAEAYFYDQQYEQSLKYFEQFIANAPNSDKAPNVYFFMGENYRMLQQYEHADIAYSTALRKQTKIPLWYFRLGQVKEKSGDVEGAKKAYQQTLKLSPNYPDATAALNRLQ